MSGTPPTADGQAGSRSVEWLARVISALVLGGISVAALLRGGLFFGAVVIAVAVAAAVEWHRLINDGRFARETVVTAFTVAGVVWALQGQGHAATAMLVIAAGACLTALSALLRGGPQTWSIRWHAFGTPYIALSVLALVLLRGEARGAAIVGGLFVAIWMADTGALLFGRMIGGPKLAPILSPNKTWAGFLCGTAVAGAAEAAYVAAFGGAVTAGLAFGILLALAGHSGDLFESWVKRQFHAKNMGHLIPGHGGMLDRIDSLLFAAPLYAALTYFAGINPLSLGGS